jgi:hypothetical protein
MKKFNVTITETLKKTVEVEAENIEEAEQIVTDSWYKGDHVLDAECFEGVEFSGEEVQAEKIKVILLEPNKLARVEEIDASLEGMQSIVGGLIQPGYFFEEPVCVVLNEEGKMIGLDLNRGVYDEKKKLIDIIAGTAFICDCSGENFGSLNDEQIKKYSKMFRYPERFFKINDQIKGVPFNPKNKEYER